MAENTLVQCPICNKECYCHNDGDTLIIGCLPCNLAMDMSGYIEEEAYEKWNRRPREYALRSLADAAISDVAVNCETCARDGSDPICDTCKKEGFNRWMWRNHGLVEVVRRKMNGE